MSLKVNGLDIINDARRLTANISNLSTVGGLSLIDGLTINVVNGKLLGTLTTTSGTAQNLTSLTLTGYKWLIFVFNDVSHNNATGTFIQIGDGTTQQRATPNFTSGQSIFGMYFVNLSNSVFFSATRAGTAGTGISAAATDVVGRGDITNSSTTLRASMAAGSFDRGSIRVFGHR